MKPSGAFFLRWAKRGLVYCFGLFIMAVDTRTFGMEGSLQLIEDAVKTWARARQVELG